MTKKQFGVVGFELPAASVWQIDRLRASLSNTRFVGNAMYHISRANATNLLIGHFSDELAQKYDGEGRTLPADDAAEISEELTALYERDLGVDEAVDLNDFETEYSRSYSFFSVE